MKHLLFAAAALALPCVAEAGIGCFPAYFPAYFSAEYGALNSQKIACDGQLSSCRQERDRLYLQIAGLEAELKALKSSKRTKESK